MKPATRVRVLVLLGGVLGALVATPGAPQSPRPRQAGPVLTPAAQQGFERLMALASAPEALGEGLGLRDIAIEGSGAVLHCEGPGGAVLRVRLGRRGSGTQAGRHFDLTVPARPERAPSLARRLGPLLDAAFPSPPWQEIAPPSDGAPPQGATADLPPWWQIGLALGLAVLGLWALTR